MAWLFLVLSLIGAWFTWNATHPIYRPSKAATVSFVCGWITGELALHHLLWQGLAVAFFIHHDVLSEVPGQFGMLATLGSWIGLLQLFLMALPTENTIMHAIGRAYTDMALPVPPSPDKTNPLGWGRVFLPFPIRRRNVIRTRDICFGRARGINLKLDVYQHISRPRNAPVLLCVHGGAWLLGSKNHQCLPLALEMASRGWVSVNVNYRLSPHATFPEQLVDIKRAIHWIRSQGDAFGADPDFLMVSGLSAGGHLASLIALTPNDRTLQPGFEDVNTEVQGCISLYGVYDLLDRDELWPHGDMTRLIEKQVLKASPEEDPARWARACPLDQVGSHAPPFLIIHGDRDSMVPVTTAQLFARTLKETSQAPVAYAELNQAQHAFDVFPSLRTNLAVRAMATFAENVRLADDPVATSQ